MEWCLRGVAHHLDYLIYLNTQRRDVTFSGCLSNVRQQAFCEFVPMSKCVRLAKLQKPCMQVGGSYSNSDYFIDLAASCSV